MFLYFSYVLIYCLYLSEETIALTKYMEIKNNKLYNIIALGFADAIIFILLMEDKF